MKELLLKIADCLGLLWQVLPVCLRQAFIKTLMVLETRGDTGKGLARAFRMEDSLLHVINERALVLGGGIHPKHRLTRYHDFFSENIADDDRVLDVGCSYGAVTRSVANAHPQAHIAGIEMDAAKLERASTHPDNTPNLKFFLGDATQNVPEGPWHTVILSNVLEHITNRTVFLKHLCEKTQCRKILIRVPFFERDWSMPMRRELGINYYSDNDHKIEHTHDEFVREMNAARLDISALTYRWGEIWAIVHPR